MTEAAGGITESVSSFLEGLPFMGVVVAGNQLWRWLLAVVLAVVLYWALRLLLSQVGSRLARLTARTRSPVDDLLVAVLRSTRKTFVAVLAVALASLVLDLGGIAADVRRWLLVIVLTIQVGLWGQRAIVLWLELQRERLLEEDPGAVTTLQGLSYVARVALWGAVIVLMLDNLGYDVTALVAGLGIGGVAVALALQNVLGDLFASLSIALDKPFVTGDFIIVDDKMGMVSNIGLKTTRVASLSGEQLVFSNSDLLSSRIRNYKRMEERRVPFTVGVLYQTPVERLEEIPGLARSIIEATENTRFDRAHFKGFGDSAYIFEFVYYVLAPDYNLFMDCQQQINLGLCRAFEERDIEFAYPTRTLHLAAETGPALVRLEGGEPDEES
ncbi:MAG TPA: mechanosensitive ion channel family protein [Candidatus Sulfomarinibacteraceae bacterium]|nr:mechanosensitive ion channel family protein [Candidatus Sulfomarinibacteraceae bacterium]